MNLGVLTIPLHKNYGGIIQAYALKVALERCGHEVWFINRDHWPAINLRKRSLEIIRGAHTAYRFRKQIPLRSYTQLDELVHIQRKKVHDFIKKNINKTFSVSNIHDITQDDFDGFVVGSDQVWRPVFARRILSTSVENVFLSFTKDWDIKRLSYAASFGVDQWEFTSDETSRCSEFVKYFDAVSVRESSGVRLCRDYLGVEAEHVLDPTMLLDSSDYDKISDTANRAPANTGLFAYILDSTGDKTEVVNNTAKFINEDAFDLRGDATFVEPIESWLRAFRDAAFVVTDSFHGCVFSILYKKHFLVYGNQLRGLARINSLLKAFNLEDRLLSSSEELTEEKLASEIDWSRIYGALAKYKSDSLSFLEKALA